MQRDIAAAAIEFDPAWLGTDHRKADRVAVERRQSRHVRGEYDDSFQGQFHAALPRSPGCEQTVFHFFIQARRKPRRL
jgi:hypothetical protein